MVWGAVAAAAATIAEMVGKAVASKKEKKSGKLRAKEMERETKLGLVSDAEQREADLESHQLSHQARKTGNKSKSMRDSTDLVRRAIT